MKLLFTIFSLILLTMAPMKAHVRSVEEETFYNNCYNAYNSYSIELDYDSEYYGLLILVGEYESNVSYSVFFEQNEENNYKLFITVGDNNGYYPSTDLKGGCSVYDLKSTSVIKIEVYQESVAKYYYELNAKTNNDYQETYKDKIILGNNKGFKSIDDKNNESKETTPLVFILSIIFTVLITGSIIVLLVFYSRKKGFFNQEYLDKEFKDEHEMRETIKDYISRFDEDNIEVEAIEVKFETKEEPVKEVYTKTKNYDFDEVRDISILLQNKGFNTNYKELSNDSKNEIMLELMKMRHLQEITDEEYRSEVIKLWM